MSMICLSIFAHILMAQKKNIYSWHNNFLNMWYKKISASINPNIGITDFIVVLYVYNVSPLHAVYKELAASG